MRSKSAALLGALLVALNHTSPLTLVALTNGGSRVVVMNGQGKTTDTYELGPARELQMGPSMAYDAKSHSVIIPVVDPVKPVTRVMTLNLSSGILRLLAQVDDTVAYAWAGMGARTGRVYLMSDHGVRAVILDRESGSIVGRVSFMRDQVHDWLVYRARVSADERRIYVSYHGGCNPPPSVNTCTTGIDWVETEGGQGAYIRDALRSKGEGCALAHGNFALSRAGVIAAFTGGLEEIDVSGRRASWTSMNLPRGHYMSFAFDSLSSMAYVASPCLYGAGIMAMHVPGSPRDAARELLAGRNICGDESVLSSHGSYLVVANTPEGLAVLDLRRSDSAHTVRFREPVKDVLAIEP